MSRLLWSAAYRLVWSIDRRRSAIAPLVTAAAAAFVVVLVRS